MQPMRWNYERKENLREARMRNFPSGFAPMYARSFTDGPKYSKMAKMTANSTDVILY